MGSTADKLKGKLKKVEGQLTGDKVREGQGWAEEKKGQVEEKIENVADKVNEKIDDAADDADNENASRR
jgi:uncharacterized protein YjbJ (UPF0337 family)